MSTPDFVVAPDGKLHRAVSSLPCTLPSQRSAASRLTANLERANRPRRERSEYERDVYEVLRDAELGRLEASCFCPVCRSEAWMDGNEDDAVLVSCEVCGYRGALSTFNVY